MLRALASLLVVCQLAAAPAAAEPQTSKSDPGSASHMLSLTLIVAGKEGKGAPEQLPAPVAKAINDIKGFLPYSHYEVHDTAVIRGANSIPVRVDLEGPDSRYVAQLQYQLTEEPRRLNVFKFELIRAYEPTAPRPLVSGEEQSTPRPVYSREVISTAFSVNVGESIVVGTSRLNGTGKALVVILTVMSSDK